LILYSLVKYAAQAGLSNTIWQTTSEMVSRDEIKG
jgi:hypothetical protein